MAKAQVRSERAVRYVRCQGLVGYWQDGAFVVDNPVGGCRTEFPEFYCQLLAFFGEPRTIDEAARTVPPAHRPMVRKALHRLRSLGFLRRPGSQRMGQRWAAWGPAAGFFHFSTRDLEWIDSRDRLDAEREFASKRPVDTESTSSKLTGRRVALPTPALGGQFPDVLTQRRTWRDFGQAAVPLASLARLLHLSFGAQAEALTSLGSRITLKTSPSPGATQSLEAYVVALNAAGVDRGVYWYNSTRHELQVLRGSITPEYVGALLAGQWWFEKAGVVVLLTGVIERIQHRYTYGRAYRSWLLEAGHVCQTFCLTATWLDLAVFCTQALSDSRVEQRLGLDPRQEPVLYAMGVGTKPPGQSVGAWPAEHSPGDPYRQLPAATTRQTNRRR